MYSAKMALEVSSNEHGFVYPAPREARRVWSISYPESEYVGRIIRTTGSISVNGYELIDENFITFDPSTNIRPTEPEYLSTIRSKLGENSLNRFLTFLKYKEGWDVRKGKPVNQISLMYLVRFLESLDSFCTTPSIFLTREGYLQLSWEDKDNFSIELEFLENGTIGYLYENPNFPSEGIVRDIQSPDLRSLLLYAGKFIN